jgi:hypothetical protein
LNSLSVITSSFLVTPEAYTSLKLFSSLGVVISARSTHSFYALSRSAAILTCFLSLFQRTGKEKQIRIIPKIKSAIAEPVLWPVVEIVGVVVTVGVVRITA